MKGATIDLILKIILSVLLFVVPTLLVVEIWFSPTLETNLYLVGLSTVNLFLSIAEVLFLVRAVVFPKNDKKWWLEW